MCRCESRSGQFVQQSVNRSTISQFFDVQKLLLDGPCKGGIANATHQSHSKSPISASVKLLVLGILLCSIAFTIAAIIKARSIKKACKARSWKLTTFQHLDFTCDDVLDSLKEDNIIGKGGVRIVYKGAMPNNELVAVKRLPTLNRGFSHDHGFNVEIQTLGRIIHRHIVRLLGFCSNQETNLLLYEYMPKSQVNAMSSRIPVIISHGPFLAGKHILYAPKLPKKSHEGPFKPIY